jgi:hypothetical protein
VGKALRGALIVIELVGIDVQRHGRASVPEHLLNGFDVRAC